MKSRACPDCGGVVSKRAKLCPHCGRPNKQGASAGVGCLAIIVLGLCLVAGSSMLGPCQRTRIQDREASAPPSPPPILEPEKRTATDAEVLAQAKADVQVFSASETTAKAAVLDRLKADTDYQNARILLEEARQAKENSTADSPHAKLALAEEYSHARLRVKRIEELALANDSGLATATRAVNESISKLRNIEDRIAADRARAAGAAERRAAAAQKDREDRTLTAAKLVRIYENNEVSADEWARGRELIISGVVESVGKDFLDDPYVSLSDGTEFSLGGVQCLFSKADTSKLTKLNKGQQVTISGICAGKTLTLVVMRDCRVE